jgi:hypothetical protein
MKLPSIRRCNNLSKTMCDKNTQTHKRTFLIGVANLKNYILYILNNTKTQQN